MTTFPASEAPKKMIDRAGLVSIYDALAAIKASFDNPMHSFRVIALRRQLAPFADPIIEVRDDASKKQPVKFNEERETLCRAYATKDPAGNPVISQMRYNIDPTRLSQFNEEAEKLKEKYADAIKDYEDSVTKINAFLKEEVEMPALSPKIPLSWFKRNVPEHLETLFDLIEDDSENAAAPAAAKAPIPFAGKKHVGKK